jgi:hypothetical protein
VVLDFRAVNLKSLLDRYCVKEVRECFEKRKEGYEPLIFGDLNYIWDKKLDAKNGGEIYPGQSNWFTTMETNADLHDV